MTTKKRSGDHSLSRPVRELKGFERVTLEPGSFADITFTVTAEDMAFCREDMKFDQEPGEFGVWVGNSSDADLEGKFIVR